MDTKKEVPDQPITDQPKTPQWTPPAPPAFGGRARFTLLIERLGFPVASITTLLILAVLFINTDLLLREPNKLENRSVVAEQPTPPDAQTTQPAPLPPETSDSTAAATIPLQEEEPLLAQASEESPSATDAEETTTPSAPDETPATSSVVEETPPVQPESPPETASSDGRQQPASNTAAQPDDTQEEPSVVEEEPVPQVGEVYFVSEPSGATVLLAGQQVGRTPFVLSDLRPGRRQVTMRLEGYRDYTTTVRVAVQERRTVNGRLEQVVSTLGTLRILVRPWGNIYIDDKLHKAESNVWYTTKLSPGTYRVRVEHPSLGIWSQDVKLVAGEERTIDYDFKPKK